MPAEIARLRPDSSAPRRIRKLTGQNGDVWRMHVVDGYTQREVAAHFGITQQRVSAIIKAVRDALPPLDRKQIVRDRVESLATVRTAIMPRVMRGDAEAIRAYLKILEREARYLGLDAPTTIAAALGPMSEPMRYVIEMDDETREALQ